MNICEKKLDSSWFRPTFPRQFFPPLRFFARSRTFSLKSVRPAFTLAKTGDILSLKDFCTYMTLKSLNSSMISMLSIKKCEILGEGLWFLRTWLLPDALPLFASSRSLVFLVAVSLASVVFEGRTHASEWHWAYLQRLDLVVGLPCPDVQRGMCSHFWWEEHKNFPQKNQKFPPRFFCLIDTKDQQNNYLFLSFQRCRRVFVLLATTFPYTVYDSPHRTIRTHV